MKRILLPPAAWLICACAGVLTPATGLGQGTQFTYQGRLTDAGATATGSYDFTAQVYNRATAGEPGDALVSGTVSLSGVGVTNGLFVLNLDFGPGVFDGSDRWLLLAVRTNGAAGYVALQPRQRLGPTPYAILAGKVASGGLPGGTYTGVFNFSNPLDQFSGTFTGDGSGLTGVNAATLGGLTPGSFWQLGGNAGTIGGFNFLGTTDNQPLELRANGSRGLRLEYAGRCSGFPLLFCQYGINVIGGYWGNSVATNVIGATIAGGGDTVGLFLPTEYPNRVDDDFGTVGGGYNNTAGFGATVPGGFNNSATGQGSFAAGRNSHTVYNGSFLWGDGTQAANGTGPNRFEALATGGVNFFTGGSGVWSDGARGYALAAGDYPIVTKGWDPFDGTAGTVKSGLGRWGLFMEFGSLVAGIPVADGLGYRQFEVARYRTDGSRDSLLTVGNDGRTTVKVLNITGGADLAEPFAMSDDSLAPGSVVVIDPENPGKLRRSVQAYDHKVAGVVSGANGIQPGISMVQADALEAGKNVALSGRVYVLVDASFASIAPGDLLTTSDTPGHAMKAIDPARAQGAVLGKAMTPLKEGKGMVLLLVSLQ